MDAIKIGCVQIDLAVWVDGGEKLLEDEQLRAVVEDFLLKSPSMGVSRMSPGFVHEQRVFTSPSAEALTKRLLDGIEHRNFFESADDLERVLAPQLASCTALWIEGEFVYQTRTKAEAMSTWLDTSEEIGRANTPGVAEGPGTLSGDVFTRRMQSIAIFATPWPMAVSSMSRYVAKLVCSTSI